MRPLATGGLQLALLICTAWTLGCADGTIPGPDTQKPILAKGGNPGPPGGGGGGESTPVHLLVSGGTVVNAERIVFRDATDNARRLVVSSSRNQPTAGEVTVAFAGSAAAYAAPCVNGLCGQCLLTPATTDQLTADALAAEFNLTRSPAGIGVSINKRNLKKAGDTSTADHSLSSGHDSGTFGGANVVLHVREWTEFGDPSVTLLEKDADNGDGRTRSVYRFNGGQNRGAVRAWLRDQGGASSDVKLACPMLDDVTVTVLEG